VETLDLLINRIDAARNWTRNLLADLSDREWFFQPGPGLHSPAWIVGHLTWAEWGLAGVRCCEREPLPPPTADLFGRGSIPSGDPKSYPSIAELRAQRDQVHNDLLPLIRKLTPAQLAQSPKGDPHPMFSTRGQVLGMVAMHESFHAGQLALLRRLMGRAAQR